MNNAALMYFLDSNYWFVYNIYYKVVVKLVFILHLIEYFEEFSKTYMSSFHYNT